MKVITHIYNLIIESRKSDIAHKHACIAFMNGTRITPYLHNYKRPYIYRCLVGTLHAEMNVLHHILIRAALNGSNISHLFYNIYNNVKLTKSNISTLKKIKRKFSKISLFVVKSSNTLYNLGNSRPCITCLKMMKAFGIKNIYYSMPDYIMIESILHMETTHESNLSINMNKIIYT